MKILSVVGARPNFVKMFPLIETILQSKHEHILVHTGQHYDINMSDIFFKEMNVKPADYNLGVGSGNHGAQTGEILKKVEEVFLKEKPDVVIVPGDTNSTIGGALAAVKLHIPVVHLEAGLRSFDRRMPEEINRILTDHCSDILLCPTKEAVSNLANEGITDKAFYIGDTMYEISFMIKERLDAIELPFKIPEKYVLSTIHRAENTTTERLPKIMESLKTIDLPVILPIHPRTKKILIELGLYEEVKKKIQITQPLGFLEFSKLLMNSTAIITDSGGVQKEAYWHEKPCITVRENTEWNETLSSGGNILSEPEEIRDKLKLMLERNIDFDENLFGFKDTSKRALTIIEQEIK
ncbi:MAG: non-hydrolyzing UDP-N-acetylglucosamine 2-epimerase [Candidatus Thorarchaeota archaeon]